MVKQALLIILTTFLLMQYASSAFTFSGPFDVSIGQKLFNQSFFAEDVMSRIVKEISNTLPSKKQQDTSTSASSPSSRILTEYILSAST